MPMDKFKIGDVVKANYCYENGEEASLIGTIERISAAGLHYVINGHGFAENQLELINDVSSLSNQLKTLDKAIQNTFKQIELLDNMMKSTEYNRGTKRIIESTICNLLSPVYIPVADEDYIGRPKQKTCATCGAVLKDSYND